MKKILNIYTDALIDIIKIKKLNIEIEEDNIIKNNTVYNKKSDLDQFYTNEKIAKKYFNKIFDFFSKEEFDIFLEPSAGSGSFYNLFPDTKKIGLDLDPKSDGIIKKDFFKYLAPQNKKIITIGNPPFGKNSSLAVKFFNKAADFSNVIAFIIPKTFKKQSIHNRLNLNFKLVYEEDLLKNSFILNNEPYDVPCCFQIWKRSDRKRKIIKTDFKNEYFEFIKNTNEANLAVRRVGGRSGKANMDIKNSNKNCHYFLKVNTEKITVNLLLEEINKIDFSDIVNSTAGVKSLSKPEFLNEILKIINKL